ncbi:hypothetical protein C5167_010314 [Papaver somniferum]|uniref:Uncharacterized protein n=1 Tax=Papaver somniferum TaxID=3469 RepID=A0A4Y7K3R8_PAPSO|nr:hypothetical protein C5167_010314 [Papaver somniferum]
MGHQSSLPNIYFSLRLNMSNVSSFELVLNVGQIGIVTSVTFLSTLPLFYDWEVAQVLPLSVLYLLHPTSACV